MIKLRLTRIREGTQEDSSADRKSGVYAEPGTITYTENTNSNKELEFLFVSVGVCMSFILLVYLYASLLLENHRDAHFLVMMVSSATFASRLCSQVCMGGHSTRETLQGRNVASSVH